MSEVHPVHVPLLLDMNTHLQPDNEEQLETPNEENIESVNISSEMTSAHENIAHGWNSTSKHIDQSLLNILECPVCYEYMAPPISMCENGHNICYNCRPRLFKCPTCRQSFLTTRNVALEQIARDLQFPCQNPQITCPDLIKYCCPLSQYMQCSWQGKHTEIRGHVEDMHQNKILLQHDSSCTWDLILATKDTKVIFAYNEIFLYRLKLDTINKLFFVTVHYIGPKNNSSKYNYQIQLSAGNQNVLMCNVTTANFDVEEVYRSRNCITIEYELVNKISKEKQFNYALTINSASVQ